MPRYIDADALFKKAIKYREYYDGFIALQKTINLLKSAPPADVVEVVRCKDCEFYDPFVHRLKGNGTCAFWDNMQTGENTFCSHGCKKKTV